MSIFLISEPLPYYEPRSFDSRIKRIELLRVKGQCYEAEGEKETSNPVPQHNQKKGGKTLSSLSGILLHKGERVITSHVYPVWGWTDFEQHYAVRVWTGLVGRDDTCWARWEAERPEQEQ